MATVAVVRFVLWLGCVSFLVLGVRAGRGETPQWFPLAKGVWEQRLAANAPETGLPVELHCVRLDLAQAQLRIVDARDYGAKAFRARELAQQSSALAVINASFFEPDLRPMGLLIQAGREINPLRRADWGVFYIDETRAARIVHTNDWRGSPAPKAELAIQAGPRLVVDGEVTKVRPHLARRSGVCIEAEGRVVLVASAQPLFLSEFAELLRRPIESGGLACRFALNLDGGSSTQLEVAKTAVGVRVAQGVPVPIGLGVFLRPPEAD